jgi:hypothetical protein
MSPGIRRTLRFWRSSLTTQISRVLGGAVLCSLFYAAGSASLAGIFNWLSSTESTLTLATAMSVGLFIVRPFFFTKHIKLVTKAAAIALDDYAAQQGRPLKQRAFVKQTVLATIILTRDLPTLVILSLAMVWHGGLMGLAITTLVLGGLLAAAPARRLGFRRHQAKVSKRIAESHAVALGQRYSRAWAEASAEIALMALVVILIFVKAVNVDMETARLTSIVLIAMLLTSPLRRIARLLALESSADEDD